MLSTETRTGAAAERSSASWRDRPQDPARARRRRGRRPPSGCDLCGGNRGPEPPARQPGRRRSGVHGRECLRQVPPRAEDQRLDCGLRLPGGLGDLRVGEPLPLAQQDHAPQVLRHVGRASPDRAARRAGPPPARRRRAPRRLPALPHAHAALTRVLARCRRRGRSCTDQGASSSGTTPLRSAVHTRRRRSAPRPPPPHANGAARGNSGGSAAGIARRARPPERPGSLSPSRARSPLQGQRSRRTFGYGLNRRLTHPSENEATVILMVRLERHPSGRACTSSAAGSTTSTSASRWRPARRPIGALGTDPAALALLAAGAWLVVKDWRDLFPGSRDTASWRLGIHRAPRRCATRRRSSGSRRWRPQSRSRSVPSTSRRR